MPALSLKPRNTSRSATTFGLLGMLSLAHAPLVGLQMQHMWGRPHYRFFPLLLAVVVLMMLQRRARLRETTYVRGVWLERSLLTMSLMLLSAAVALHSPFLSSASAVLATGFALVHVWGLRAVSCLFGPWMLLWFLVPPPLGADLTIITQLQAVTSRLSSLLLDFVAVDHVMAGNVLHLSDHTFLIDEACSGVNSLIALLSAAAVWLVTTSSGVRRGAVLLGLTVLWAMLLNVVRVLIIALSHVWWQSDLSTGWVHEGLGLVMFSTALLLVLSTDQLLQFAGYWLKRFASMLRRRTRSSRHRYYGYYSTRSRRVLAVGPDSPRSEESPRIVAVPSPAMALLGMVTYGLLFAAEVAGMATGDARHFSTEALPEVSREFLPEQIGGWKLVSYEPVDRDTASDFGNHSDRWVYGRPGLEVAVSIDRLFHSWHELSRCYEGQGWRRTGRETHEAGAPDEINHVAATFERETGEQGWLVFALVDGDGAALTPPATARAERVMDRLRSRETLQLQAFVARDVSLTNDEQAEVEVLFQEVARRLQSLIRATSRESVDG